MHIIAKTSAGLHAGGGYGLGNVPVRLSGDFECHAVARYHSHSKPFGFIQTTIVAKGFAGVFFVYGKQNGKVK